MMQIYAVHGQEEVRQKKLAATLIDQSPEPLTGTVQYALSHQRMNPVYPVYATHPVNPIRN
jgi:hypothetical protein